MRNRKLFDIVAVALLLAAGSALAPIGRGAGMKQASVVWGSIMGGTKAPNSNGGRG